MQPAFQSADELKALLGNQIRLRQDLIQRVIARDFEGNASAFGRSLELDDLPHRKTIFRWARQQEGLPKSPQRLLALAQALDVDPFLLLQIDLDLMLRCCRLAAWNLTWGSVHKALAFLNGLLALTPEDWPPPELAEGFDGSWYHHDLIHDAQQWRNDWQPLALQPELFYRGDGALDGARDPQAWYIAFRDISLQSGSLTPMSYWRPFGMLWLEQQQLRLVNFIGLQDQAAVPLPEQGFVVETFFGQGAAQFRLASLHPFELLTVTPDLPRVRFGFSQ